MSLSTHFIVLLLLPFSCLSLLVECDITKELDPEDPFSYCPARYAAKQLQPGDYCLLRPERVHPTQVFVGKVEMECAKAQMEYLTSHELRTLLMDNYVPTVIGPNGEFFITDHHHFAVALFEAFLDYDRPVLHRVLYACIQTDYSNYNLTSFWRQMMNQRYVFLEDEHGNNITTADLPETLKLMADNPYRTFASWLRKSNAYIKCGGKKTKHLMQCKNVTAPFFIECYWADFMRKIYPLNNYPVWPDMISPESDFIYRAALQLQVEAFLSVYEEAIKVSLTNQAANLPGFNIERDKMPPAAVKIDNHGCPA
jgi:hypothetical protein